jgi:hypothetical protein
MRALTTTAALILTLLYFSSSTALAQNADNETINKFISTQASRERGEEYEAARKVVEGDLNRDGVSDVVVLYTIEGQDGTNNYVQYLAAFVRKNGALMPVPHTSVGGKNYRSVELEFINKGVIALATLKYAKKDPSCCPSKKGLASYMLVKGKLKEVRMRM